MTFSPSRSHHSRNGDFRIVRSLEMSSGIMSAPIIPHGKDAMADKVRVGIAGLGKAARMKLGIFKNAPRVEFTAGADIRPEERERFKRLYGIETFSSVEEMCKEGPIDAVWIFLPHHLHAHYTEVVADHGKHLLVEKPMAVTMNEAHRM